MNMFHKMMVGTAGLAMIAGAAAPAAAQQYGYSQYDNQYGNQGGSVVGQILNNVLGGGRYGSYGQGNDRMAVDQCARAAEVRVSGDRNYGAYGQGQYGQGQYGQGYNNNRSNARVVAVTSVSRANNGLRVMGLIDTGRNWRGQNGYANAGQYAELRFNCRVDFRGQVTRLTIERNNNFRR